jgi:hypothetical protein
LVRPYFDIFENLHHQTVRTSPTIPPPLSGGFFKRLTNFDIMVSIFIDFDNKLKTWGKTDDETWNFGSV